MATTVARLEAVLSANTRDFDRGMDRSQSKMGKVGKVAGAAGLAIAGGLAVGLEKSVHAAMNAQAATSRLEVAFKTAHLEAGKYKKQVDELEKSGRKLGFTDEDTKKGLGSLLVATHNMRKASKDLSVAQDVARFKNIDLESATKMLTMAQAGSQRATKQLGLTVAASTVEADKAKVAYDKQKEAINKQWDALGPLNDRQKEQKFIQLENAEIQYKAAKAVAVLTDKNVTAEKVIDLVNQKLHGQSQAYADTAAGGMAKFHAETDHLEVALGTKLLPALTKILNKVTAFAEYLGSHPKITKGLELGVIALTTALLAAAAAQLALNLAVLANPYVAATVATIALAGGVALLYAKFKQLRPALEFVLETFVGLPLPLRLILAAMGGVQGAMDKAHGPIMKVADAFHTVYNWVKKLIDIVKDLIGWLSKIHVPHLPSIPGHGGGSDAGYHANAAQSQEIARTLMVSKGWGTDQFGALNKLWTGESGWRWNALNRSSGAYGIPQSLPASKMASAGSDWKDNAATQIAWGLNYIKGRYGSPNSAYSAWQSRSPHWYDKGGWLPTGLSLAMNNTGRPERVLAASESGTMVFNFPNYVGSKSELMGWLQNAAAEFRRRNGRSAF